MSSRVFLDTNVLVYLFDRDAPEKQARAREILKTEGASGRALLSTQVLQEFYVSVTRKLAEPLDPEVAYRVVEDFAALPLVSIDTSLILTAIKRHQREQVSFWDALIIEAALTGGASLLYTEDLQHGRAIEGLRIENPFLTLTSSPA
jgi:Predicted nucleic-acid-binding protein, contains PIN domain